MTAETDVLAANRAFYSAFANRQLDVMRDLWASEHAVACIHPGWDCLHGRHSVLSSWKAILTSPHSPEVGFAEENVVLLGDSAFVTCIEKIGEAELIATNIFAQERDGWKLVHHHAAPIARKASSEPPPRERLN